MKPSLPHLDRRTLLIGGGVGVGLVVAFAVWPRHGDGPLRAGGDEALFGAFLKIGRDGRVTVAVPQTETGQGAWTALPQILADELGAAWETVAVEPAPSAAVYANPFAAELGWLDGFGALRSRRLRSDGFMRLTAGATSVRAFERPMRRAGAAARAQLIAAAAERLGVDPAECDARNGFVVCGAERLPFGELAERAAAVDAPSDPPLRRPGTGALVRQPLQRLDLSSKSDGSFRFAGDVRLPEMLFASARIAPPGGRVTGFRRANGIVGSERWVAGIGRTWWEAERALAAADVRFSGQASVDAGALRLLIADALDSGKPEPLFARGDYESAVEGSRPLAASYESDPAMHLGLEPLGAAARLRDGRLELWAGTQAPEFTRSAAAEAVGIPTADVLLYPMPVGDGGGRALEADAAPVAAALAKRLGRPVQLTISPAASQNHDRPAPAAAARLAALPASDGTIAAWRMRIASEDGMGSALARLAGSSASNGWGGAGRDGSVPPYGIPNVQVDAVAVPMPFTAGYMRAEPQRTLSFFTESFIDELARLTGSEPLAFRMAMLGTSPRLARCLAAVAAQGGWDGGGRGSTLGLAAASAYGSHIALLADATLGAGQRIEVHRLIAAVDCGRIVNPGLVRQQVEGAMLWGLGQAVVQAPDFAAGVPRARPLGLLGLPRIAGTPQVDVTLVDGSAAPGGVSGLGAIVVAPALANAIAAATGKRLRRLPLDPMASG